MELRALEYFVAVAEERQFTRAAARVHITQSGLSATIRSLEAELRAPLFTRTTRRVKLTPAGEALLPEARRALSAARAGAEAVSDIQGLRRGRITLGVMQQMSVVDLPRTLGRFTHRYPGVELRLRQAPARDLYDALAAGELDIAITSPPPPPGDSRLTGVELLRTPLVLACREDDPLAECTVIDAAELSARRLVGFPSGWAIHTLAERLVQRSGISLDFQFEVNDTATALDLVEAGVGVMLIAEALATKRRKIRAVPLRGPSIDWVVCGVTVDPVPGNPAARQLWDLITGSKHPSRPDASGNAPITR